MRKHLTTISIIIFLLSISCTFFKYPQYCSTGIISNHTFTNNILSFALNYFYNEIPYEQIGYKVFLINLDEGIICTTIVNEITDYVYLCQTNENIYISNSCDSSVITNRKMNIQTCEIQEIEDTLISHVSKLDVSPNEVEFVCYKNSSFQYHHLQTGMTKEFECLLSDLAYKSLVDWNNRNIIYIEKNRLDIVEINIDSNECDTIIRAGDTINTYIIKEINAIKLFENNLIIKVQVEIQDTLHVEYIKENRTDSTSYFETSSLIEFYGNEYEEGYFEVFPYDNKLLIYDDEGYQIKNYDIAK